MKSVLTFLFPLVLVSVLLSGCDSDKQPKSSDKPIKSTEKATTSDKAPDFANMTDVKQKKAAFFNYLYPLALEANQAVLVERKQVQDGDLASPEVKALCEKYSNQCDAIDKAKKQQLLMQIDVIAPSLLLAQAANESAWGTSRFAQQANNYFGQWCFKQGCGLVPKQRSGGAVHEVRKFGSAEQSVASYIFNLNTSAAYEDLRAIRAKKRSQKQSFTGADLADGLLKYSQRGSAYIKELKAMMKHNRLGQYDQKFWASVE